MADTAVQAAPAKVEIDEAKIDTWLEKANRSDETAVETMRSLLIPFLESNMSGKKRKRSVDLIGARIGLLCPGNPDDRGHATIPL